ncbi:MAG: GDP-mannose 4,6-dehydratase, partial [Gemmatimonadales bacterium]
TYAASKLAAEIALKQAADRRGFRLIVARAFPHSGRGQNPVFVLPSLADKILLAKSVGASAVTVGNIDVIREMMHVDDVVDAYVRLLDCGEVGTYNVAAGQGYRLSELFTRLANIADATVIPEADTSLIRTTDIPVLVGDGTKIREVTGWTPVKNVEDVLLDVLEDARARISA